MSSDPPQTNGITSISSSDYFKAIGQQVDQVAPATNGAELPTDDDDVKPVEEIESLCMNCHENGMTRLLLTKIPYFREIIIMSFSCEHCGFHNNEIQAAGSVQPKGTHYELRPTVMADFSRQVVKADTATVKFIELDLEIPAGKGQLTNVEGLLSSVVDDLELGQEARKEQQPEVHGKIAEIITRARAMLAGQAFPFRVYVDDPAGNSWIAPDLRDGVGKWEKREYERTSEQNEALGLSDTTGQGRLDDNEEIIPDEVYSFPASCPGCMHPCVTHMKMVDIPHFKQVVLMSTLCDACGYKSNDVKTGGAVPEKGKKISLKVLTSEDLARDILKSESCALECPELQLSVNPGTLGGRFTTVEGLLTQVRDDLRNQIFQVDGHSGEGGDSLSSEEKTRWTAFFEGLDDATQGRKEFTVVLTDPLASSYVQSMADDPTQPDAQMTVEDYERTEEEEEDLGLKDMKVEGYETEEKKEEEEQQQQTASS
ncbi:zf-ZPR1-domain-containing protein [Cryphonectria parasitica EP155]|uniref:Zf-ZPR1-domain-containing protein n=1 Tax=Cryphonectria parasitica (strain ATCC 38755 / EP155) TaxID=660469 RepID=A0A9P4Y325_CRYP1|nr:zf-ZPR1-domain-containing protein [Cryphonectria parasitica EP155]KAF3765462.1 zf-ZPR1-domain-containing protein [Cryphonectria parasitica EP155]